MWPLLETGSVGEPPPSPTVGEVLAAGLSAGEPGARAIDDSKAGEGDRVRAEPSLFTLEIESAGERGESGARSERSGERLSAARALWVRLLELEMEWSASCSTLGRVVGDPSAAGLTRSRCSALDDATTSSGTGRPAHRLPSCTMPPGGGGYRVMMDMVCLTAESWRGEVRSGGGGVWGDEIRLCADCESTGFEAAVSRPPQHGALGHNLPPRTSIAAEDLSSGLGLSR